jgi:hypothetical protein
MPSRARAGNLTAALVVVAALELVLNRLANRLFLPRSIVSGASAGATAVARAVGDAGPFLFYLTGVLALLMLSMALRRLLYRGELYPRTALVRLVITVLGIAFWMVAALAVLAGRVPPQFMLPLETSFGLLSLLTAGAFLRARVPARVKVGVGLFALPAALHVGSAVLESVGWLRGRVPGSDLSPLAEAWLILAAASAPFTLVPRPTVPRLTSDDTDHTANQRRQMTRRVGALAVAVVVTAVLLVALKVRYDLVQAIALYGPHLEIPRLGSLMGLAYLAATLGWTYAVARLFSEGGASRLSAFGLLLLAIAGYPLGSPVELSVSLLGLLSLSVGQLRAYPGAGDRAQAGNGAPAPLNRAEWRAWVGRLATTLNDGSAPEVGPPEAVVVEEDQLEASRIRGHRRGRGIGMRFLRRRGQIGEIEMTVGDPGHREPTATIERHRSWLARSPDQRLPLPRVKTGDAAFDQKFSVHGDAPLRTEAVRLQLMRQDEGIVSLWKGTAARYHATSGHIDTDAGAIVAFLDTLIDLIEAEVEPERRDQPS